MRVAYNARARVHEPALSRIAHALALVFTRADKLYWTATIDFGIAMLHAELGALHAGVRGTWVLGTDAEVARFVPDLQA